MGVEVLYVTQEELASDLSDSIAVAGRLLRLGSGN